MAGYIYRDIRAFLTVAHERSFTRAAARLGVSQSALSHTIKTLETRLGLRLLTRTTRSVTPTEAGERLIQRVAPRLSAIDEELATFNRPQNMLAVTVRLSASDYAYYRILRTRLSHLRTKYPEIKIEITIEPEPFAQPYDAVISFGASIAKEMTALRITPDIRMVLVAAPAWLASHPQPEVPADLTQHDCIILRSRVQDTAFSWELAKNDQRVLVQVKGRWIFNCLYPVVDAAVMGDGIACIPEDTAAPWLASGALQAVLTDWWITLPGLHICYASRPRLSPALASVVEALRYPAEAPPAAYPDSAPS